DGDGDDRTVIRRGKPWNEKRRVQAAGEGEQNGLGALWEGAQDDASCQMPKMLLRRSRSLRCSRALSVAMKIVSSPESVPTTSGQADSSIATATLWAVPVDVFTTVSDGPAVRTSMTK